MPPWAALSSCLVSGWKPPASLRPYVVAGGTMLSSSLLLFSPQMDQTSSLARNVPTALTSQSSSMESPSDQTTSTTCCWRSGPPSLIRYPSQVQPWPCGLCTPQLSLVIIVFISFVFIMPGSPVARLQAQGGKESQYLAASSLKLGCIYTQPSSCGESIA